MNTNIAYPRASGPWLFRRVGFLEDMFQRRLKLPVNVDSLRWGG